MKVSRQMCIFPALGIITGPVFGKAKNGRYMAIARWTFEVIATDSYVWRPNHFSEVA